MIQNVKKKWATNLNSCHSCLFRENNQTILSNLADIFVDTLEVSSGDFGADELIYRQGDKDSYIYTITSGIIMNNIIDDSYKIRTIELLSDSMSIGLEAICNKEYLQNAISLSPVSLCRIRISQECMKSNMDLLNNITKKWQDKYVNQIETIKFTTGATDERICKLFHFISLHTHKNEKNIFYMPYLKHISSIVNVSVENCSRVIAKMKKNDTIKKIDKNSFFITT